MKSEIKRNNLNFIDKINKFFFTPKIFLILGGILFFAILNYLFFGLGFDWAGTSNPWGFGEPNENGGFTVVGNGPDSWYGYLNITISTLGGLLTIFALILTVRLDKKFIIPVLFGESLVVLDALLIGALFTGISYVLMIFASIYNYITWGNREEDNKSKMNLKVWFFLGSFLFFYIFIGLLYIGISDFNGGLTGSFISVWGNWYDVVGSGIVVTAYFMMYQKWKYSFFIFLITDFIYMIFFFQIGLWSTASSYIVYLFTDSMSMITWWNKDDRISEGKPLKIE